MANPADPIAFLDARAVDRIFGEEPRTLQRFEEVARANPEAGRVLWSIVSDQAIGARRADLLQKYGAGFKEELAKAKTSFETLAARPTAMAGVTELSRERFVTQAAGLIRMAVEAGEIATARTLQAEALAIAPDDPQLKAALPPR